MIEASWQILTIFGLVFFILGMVVNDALGERK